MKTKNGKVYVSVLTYYLRIIIVISTLICNSVEVIAQQKILPELITIAHSEGKFTLDTLTLPYWDSGAERIRNLLFNSLVKKNEKFEYVGELAKDIKLGKDNRSLTFTLQDNVKFSNGKTLTSADVKYTFDALFRANGYKAGLFFDNVAGQKQPHIVSIAAPNAKMFVIKVARPALVNQLLSNLIAIPIIPEGTIEQQKTFPLGTGAFKFVHFDPENLLLELEANPNYWEGAPKIQKLRVKSVVDSYSLQMELRSGRVDIAPFPVNLSPDILTTLEQDLSLKVVKSDGSDIQYLGFNTEAEPLNNVKVRQAIAYAINREKIINDLLLGQAKVAHSILPEESWAYSSGTKYTYDPNKAQQLLDEAKFKDTNNDGIREMPTITFKISVGNAAVSNSAQVIQSQLLKVGIPVKIETLEVPTLRSQIQKGQFQMTIGRWVNGNQDPLFLRDIFASSEIPNEKRASRNRSRYSNSKVDELLEKAINATNREKTKWYYAQVQEIISRDLPLFPLWYPSYIVVANKRIGNIKIKPTGDWSFVKDITISN